MKLAVSKLTPGGTEGAGVITPNSKNGDFLILASTNQSLSSASSEDGDNISGASSSVAEPELEPASLENGGVSSNKVDGKEDDFNKIVEELIDECSEGQLSTVMEENNDLTEFDDGIEPAPSPPHSLDPICDIAPVPEDKPTASSSSQGIGEDPSPPEEAAESMPTPVKESVENQKDDNQTGPGDEVDSVTSSRPSSFQGSPRIHDDEEDAMSEIDELAPDLDAALPFTSFKLKLKPESAMTENAEMLDEKWTIEGDLFTFHDSILEEDVIEADEARKANLKDYEKNQTRLEQLYQRNRKERFMKCGRPKGSLNKKTLEKTSSPSKSIISSEDNVEDDSIKNSIAESGSTGTQEDDIFMLDDFDLENLSSAIVESCPVIPVLEDPLSINEDFKEKEKTEDELNERPKVSRKRKRISDLDSIKYEDSIKAALKCQTCSETVADPLALQVHMRIHTGERPYKCKKCGEGFIDYKYLEEHLENTHGEVSPSKAKPVEIDDDEKTDETFQPVTKRPRLGRPRKLNFTKENLKRSGPKSAKSKLLSSVFKSKTTKESGQIPDAVKEESQPPIVLAVKSSYICPFCKLAFQQNMDLIEHLETHTGKDPFKCLHCDKSFQQARQLEQHKRMEHRIVKRHCMKNQIRRVKFFDEVSSVSAKQTGFTASEKQFRFNKQGSEVSAGKTRKKRREPVKKRPSVVDKTQLVAGDDNDDDCGFETLLSYRCKYCKKISGDKRTMRLHVRIHTGENTIQCPHCPRQFVRKQEYDLHVKSAHTSGKSISCSMCGFAFGNDFRLRQHLKEIHEVIVEKKLVSCQHCPKQLRNNRDMQLHIKAVHKSGKSISCSKCGIAFAAAYSLTRHLLVVHGQRNINQGSVHCSVCFKRFPNRNLMLLHAKRAHAFRKPTATSSGENFEHAKTLQKDLPEMNKEQSQELAKKSISCPHCPKQFSAHATMLLHVRQAHELGKEMKCPKCKIAFPGLQHLRMHIRQAHGIKDRLKKSQEVTTCPKCPKVFKRWDNHNLFLHLTRAHASGVSITCPKCEIALGSERSLKIHLRKVHGIIEDNPQKNVFSCPHCPKTTNNETNMLLHVKRAHAPGLSITCPKCQIALATDTALKIHLTKVHGEGAHPQNPKDVFSCPHCPKTLTAESNMLLHIKNAHESGKSITCSKCAIAYGSDKCLKMHMRKVHGIGNRPQSVYACTRCPKTFSRSDSLLLHVRSAHESGKSITCSKCEIAFGSEKTLIGHLRQVHGIETRSTCPRCPKTFDHKSTMLLHLKKAHDSRKSVSCQTCGMGFGAFWYLRKHLQDVHGEEVLKNSEPSQTHAEANTDQIKEESDPVLDEVKVENSEYPNIHFFASCFVKLERCDKLVKMHLEKKRSSLASSDLSKTKSSLKKYNKGMFKKPTMYDPIIKRYICTTCGKRFASPGSLRNHKVLHSDLKPHKCTFCNDSFKMKQYLKHHLVVKHGQDVGIKCNICGKQFSSNFFLKCHMKTHFKLKPHKCSVCSATFTIKRNLNDHMQVHLIQG